MRYLLYELKIRLGSITVMGYKSLTLSSTEDSGLREELLKLKAEPFSVELGGTIQVIGIRSTMIQCVLTVRYGKIRRVII